MTFRNFTKTSLENVPENYEHYFVPVIGLPLAEDLVELASLRRGESVLDVACGTGVVAQLASEKVGPDGYVAGLDANPGMLAIARNITTENASIEWYEANAEAMPLSDHSFDVAFCQMGLQFMDNKVVALKEMRRVLSPGGRLFLNLPGPAANIFSLMEKSMEKHISNKAAGFLKQVFSLYKKEEIQRLFRKAGFNETDIQSSTKRLTLPPAEEFLWQYVYGTPLAALLDGIDDKLCLALELEVKDKWQNYSENGSTIDGQPMVTIIARN